MSEEGEREKEGSSGMNRTPEMEYEQPMRSPHRSGVSASTHQPRSPDRVTPSPPLPFLRLPHEAIPLSHPLITTRKSVPMASRHRIGDRKMSLREPLPTHTPPTSRSSAVLKKVRLWTVDDVAIWLEGHHMSEYTADFRKNLIDGEVLLEMDGRDLTTLHVRDHHVTPMLNAIEMLKGHIVGESDMSQWSIVDVSRWLLAVGMEEYVTLFREELLDGETLQDMTKEDFILLSVKESDAEVLMEKIKKATHKHSPLSPAPMADLPSPHLPSSCSQPLYREKQQAGGVVAGAALAPPRVKVSFKKDIRVVVLSPNETMESFMKKIHKEFGKGKVVEFCRSTNTTPSLLLDEDDFEDVFSLAQQKQQKGKTLRLTVRRGKERDG